MGRILTLSVIDSPEQKLVGQILASLITERTGTTVNVKTVPNTTTNEKQLSAKDADIIINYINSGLAHIDGSDKKTDAQEAYGLVKQYYSEKLDIVWLKPFGYNGPFPITPGADNQGVSLAIPVTTKDVLNRFPVLDRVINKLVDRLDEKTLQHLLEKTKTGKIPVVVKEFLKAQNLI